MVKWASSKAGLILPSKRRPSRSTRSRRKNAAGALPWKWWPSATRSIRRSRWNMCRSGWELVTSPVSSFQIQRLVATMSTSAFSLMNRSTFSR